MVMKEDSSDRRLIMQLKQKSFSRFEYLMDNFIRCGDLLTDPCPGQFLAAKACMLLPEHRLCFGCAVDSSTFERALPNMV